MGSSLSPPVPPAGTCHWSSVSRRQVLHFHASACDELTPPIHRAPPGPRAGSSLAEGAPPGAPMSRRPVPIPGFDAIWISFDASAVVHTRSSSRRSPDPVTPGLSPERSPRRLLTDAASGGLGSPPARRTRRANLHHWHSTGLVLTTFYVIITPPSWTHELHLFGADDGIRTRDPHLGKGADFVRPGLSRTSDAIWYPQVCAFSQVNAVSCISVEATLCMTVCMSDGLTRPPPDESGVRSVMSPTTTQAHFRHSWVLSLRLISAEVRNRSRR